MSTSLILLRLLALTVIPSARSSAPRSASVVSVAHRWATV